MDDQDRWEVLGRVAESQGGYVIPSKIHLTLPRRYRHRTAPVTVRFHYPGEPLAAGEVREVRGVPITSPERTILDALEAGTQPEQIEMAVRQAIDRPLTTPKRLRAAAAGRAGTVQSVVERLLRE